MKTISCKDMGVDCPWVGKAKSEDEVMKMAKDHAMNQHKDFWNEKMSKMSDEEMKKMMMPHIKDA